MASGHRSSADRGDDGGGSAPRVDAGRQREGDLARARIATAQRLRGTLGDDPAGGDDRDAVSELLGLVHVVGGEEDRLASACRPWMTSQAARRANGSNPVVGSSRKSSSGSPISASATSRRRRWPPDRRRRAVGLLGQPAPRSIVSSTGSRSAVVPGVELQTLADGEPGFGVGLLQHDADPVAPLRPGVRGVDAEHRTTSPPVRCGSPPGSRRSSSCRRRWGRGRRTSRRGGPRGRCRAPPRRRRSSCGGPARDGGVALVRCGERARLDVVVEKLHVVHPRSSRAPCRRRSGGSRVEIAAGPPPASPPGADDGQGRVA